MQDVLLFTSQGIATFYDKLFSSIEFVLPRASTGRKGYSKEAMLCAFIVMKCEDFSQITDLRDFLQCNLLIAYYCGFDITRPLPSYWTFDRRLREFKNGDLKEIISKVPLRSPRGCQGRCPCRLRAAYPGRTAL